MTNTKTKLIDGNTFVDDRGIIKSVNNFEFDNVKRFYHVENYQKNIIRAFHGHLKEGKYVYVPKGSALICVARIGNNIKLPQKKDPVERIVLSSQQSQILYIPPGYANGFKSLEDDTIILFFSTSRLRESKNDDYRYPYDYWGKEIWDTVNR
ncbi:MAG: dTDP-4-dehydrorhamnose 3,5-epimerase family protein [Bacteroidota bacterium]